MERVPSHALENPGTTSLGRRVTAVLPSRDRSGFRLLSSGDTAYRARLALVDQAEQSLDLQYYVVERDPSTRELFARIRRAAEYGVRVRILLDDLNTVSRDAALARYAAHRNVQIRLFNPFPAARSSLASRFLVAAADLGRLTRRMHNKLFVADNAVAIAGGRNLGAAYFEGTDDVNFADLALENTEVGIVIDSAELGAHMARLIGQGIQPEARYALRLEPDGRTIQWTTRESGVERTYVHDPDAGFWRSLANVLLRVTVPQAPL